MPATVMYTMRRLKNRPRIAPGTRSPIHAVHALFPITPKTAAIATTPTKTCSAVPADTLTKGSAIMGSQTSRAAPIPATATALGPNA